MGPVIQAVNLTKRYPAFKSPPGFKEWVLKLPFAFRADKKPLFTALDSVSLSVKKGECLGIIGKNGAGKSTLLSLLLGTSHPTEGTLRVEGKRTPLLELGAGFHPDLTGRENATIVAVLLGLTRAEAEKKMGEIITFSEIENFVDAPVRTYSNGMYLRLAFSVAIHTAPEILLIDEVLAVGDESFQRKSEAAILSLIKSGVTTVFVSHNLEAVKKIAHRVIWVHQGKIREEGSPETVVRNYHQFE
ncbi:MAG: hypothetical protein A2901_06465 [Elusimicrobia bacterium RIFCSPLOWO2_01_FULL_54_10]|nr:MAG: hypothetical protein A2901_06465 [Elusimicrobia bacterium RIFCSPLOWO2_01_FULL_54_10]